MEIACRPSHCSTATLVGSSAYTQTQLPAHAKHRGTTGRGAGPKPGSMQGGSATGWFDPHQPAGMVKVGELLRNLKQNNRHLFCLHSPSSVTSLLCSVLVVVREHAVLLWGKHIDPGVAVHAQHCCVEVRRH